MLSDQEPFAFLAKERLSGQPHVLVEDLGVPAEHPEMGIGVLHVRDVADDVHTRGRYRHEEHRCALVRRRVRVGDGHDDEKICDRAVRGEPLVSGQDVSAVGLADCSRAELRWVGARGVRLRHRERRFQLTV